jgi:amylosucrase
VLGVLRRHPVGPMLGLYNVSGRLLRVDGAALGHLPARARDALSGAEVSVDGTGGFPLPPYAARWLV